MEAKQTAVKARKKVREERRVDKKGCCAYHPGVRITKPGKMYGFTDEGALCGRCQSEASQAESRAAVSTVYDTPLWCCNHLSLSSL